MSERSLTRGGETCDQGGVCRQSDGKHVTRAVFSQRVCLVAIVSFAKSSNFACVYACSVVFFFICHCGVGRVVAVAVNVVEHR